MSWDALQYDTGAGGEDPTWGDYGKAAASGAASAGAGLSGLMRQMYEAGNSPEAAQIFRGLQRAARSTGEDIEESMTPEARERLGAGVTTQKFLEHPFSSLALKATGMSAPLVATTVAGFLSGGGIPAMAAVGATAGAFAAGDVVEEITSKPDKMTNDQLREASPLYADFLDKGDTEEQARSKLNQLMVGAKPAIAFLLGAGTGLFGPAGNVVRGLGRGAVGEAVEAGVKTGVSKGSNFLGQHGIRAAAAEGAASEFVEEGAGALLAQQAHVQGRLREGYDAGDALDRALTGAVLGGVMGGATGIGGGHGKGKAKADEIKAARAGEEDAALQAPAGQAAIAAGQEGVAAAGAENKVVAVDPAIKAALDEKTPPPAPPAAAPDVPVPQAPATPPAPGAAPLQQPAGVTTAPDASQVPTPPPATAPQQPAPPNQSAAAPPPVTPQVTPSQLPPEIIEELKRRPITDQEIAQIKTPEDAQKIIREMPPSPELGGSAPPASAAPQTQQTPSGPPVTPTESFGPADPAVPAGTRVEVKPDGTRVFHNVKQEDVDATTAALAKTAADNKAADKKAAKAAEGPGTKKWQPHEIAAHAERDTKAKDTYTKHREAGELTTPKTPDERKALAAHLQTILDASGLELRENLPEHIRNHYSPPKGKKATDFPLTEGKEREESSRHRRSIPKQVYPETSPHVRYLRELIGVQKALLGPKATTADVKTRVENFVTSHNTGGLDLIGLSRKMAGDTIKANKRTAAQQEASETGATAASANITTPQSEGAVKGSERILSDNEKKSLAAVYEAQVNKTEAPSPPAAETSEKTAPEKKPTNLEQARGAASRIADRYAPRAEPPAQPEKPKAKPVEVVKVKASEKKAGHAETGVPITVNAFHGTTVVFEKFDNKFIGSNYVSGLGAHWFTASSDAAASYAIRLEQTQHERNAGKVAEPKGTPNIHMVKIDLKNPLVIDMEGKKYDPVTWNKELNKGRETHDGVILQNAVDGGGVNTTVYAVFDAGSVRGRFEEPTLVEETKSTAESLKRASDIGEKLKEGVTPEVTAPKISDRLVEAYAATRDISVKEARAELEAAAAKEDADNAPLNAKDLQDLTDMGYTDAAIKALGPKQARYNLEEGIQPKKTEKTEEDTAEDDKEETKEQAEAREAAEAVIEAREEANKKAKEAREEAALRRLAGVKETEAAVDPKVAEIEKAEAEAEAFKQANAKKSARPEGTERATAEELAALIPKASTAGRVMKTRRVPPKAQATPEQLREAREAYAKVQAEKAAAAAGETTSTTHQMATLRAPKARPEIKLEAGEDAIWDTPIHKARDMFGHEAEDLSPPMRAADVLRSVDLSHLPDLPQYLQGFTRRRLIEIMGDMDVYFASDALVSDVSGDYHAPAGYYDENGKGHIVINTSTLLDHRAYAHTVIHEAIHAALVHRLNASMNSKTDKGRAFFNRIATLAGELHKQLNLHDSKTDKKTAAYGFINAHEFVAEVMSNPKLQGLMEKMFISPELAQELGLPPVKKWTLWGAFTNKVREMLGMPPGTHNFLHETMKVIGRELQAERQNPTTPQGATLLPPPHLRRLSMDALKDAAVGALPNADTKVNMAGKLALAKDAVSTAWQMAGRSEKYYGNNGLLRRLFEARAFMERAKDRILQKYGGLKATQAIAKAEREYPELMTRAKDIWFDASLHDVNVTGSNDHLGKDVLMGVQAKNEVDRIQKAWADPTLNPVRKVLEDAGRFFKDIHNAVSRETINNILVEANIHDPAMAERIHNEGLNDADREKYKDSKLIRALDEVQELKRREGTYVPFRRFGDFISTANHELSVPKNATKVENNDNTLQFIDPAPKNGTEYGDARAREAVRSYLKSDSHTPQGNKLTPAKIRKVFVDRNDNSKLVEAQDPNAIPAYRVSMQTQHTEFHATRAEAINNKAALAEAGLLDARDHSRDDVYTGNAPNIQEAMGTILRSLEKQQRYIDADSTQKAAMREMFHDLTLGLSGTTSIKNSMRHRRNVAGMSHDLGRVTGDYARMTANHLAKLQYRPKIDAIFKEMRDYKEAHKYDNDAIRRDEIYKEFVNRMYGKASERADEYKKGVVSRVLQVTRLSFLAGPSYHIINAHEPWTTSLPVIAGDHGVGATTRALLDAYNLIGGRTAAVAGLKDTVKAYTNDSGFTNYVSLFKDTIGKSKTAGPDQIRRYQELIDYADARNLYSNSSIFEMSKYAEPSGNIVGRTIDRADQMANQVGTAIEAINRTVTLIPAYKLEYKKNGGNHEAAMQYAYTKAHDTMGDYSSWNAAPVFNTTLGRPLLQFKKFPQKTYNLLGNVIGGAIQGDRAAMKQFAGLMVTHGMIAGALGMPTEPFKVALLAANAVGLTGFTPEDYEYAVRQLAARVAGQKGGEIISKGLYRGLGIELSGRTGLNDLLTRGVPKSNKDADLKSFLFDTMAGASGGYLLNQVQGAQALMKGDFATAIEKMSPLRTISDVTKAITGAADDKKTDSGKVKQERFGPWDTFVRLMGFTPSSTAEYGALRGTIARESKQLSAARSELINGRLEATGPEIVKVQRAIQAFNASVDKDAQITTKDLHNAANRRKTDAKKTVHGTPTNKRIRGIQNEAEMVFNP